MITDNGRCGSTDSVGGFESAGEIERFITQIPSRSRESWGKLELQGVIVEIDETGSACKIELVKQPVQLKQEAPAVS